MPPGGAGSTPGNIADGDVPRRRRIFIRRSTEKMSPENLEFVCAVDLGIGFMLSYNT